MSQTTSTAVAECRTGTDRSGVDAPLHPSRVLPCRKASGNAPYRGKVSPRRAC